MALNDDNLTDKLLTAKIDDQKNSVCKFFMISRIKFHLVSKSNQAIVFLNGLIDCTISNTK